VKSQKKVEEKIEIKPVEKKPEVNILDLDYEPKKEVVQEEKPAESKSIFDLLDEPTSTEPQQMIQPNQPPIHQLPNPNDYGTLDLLGTGSVNTNENNPPPPPPPSNNINLNLNEFTT
jgi:hypothetical protein